MSTYSSLANRPFNVQNHYLNEETADVFFICRNDETTERIPAHKILLAASANVFDKMFYGDLREDNEIQIADATPNGFRHFLRYFYFNDLGLSLELIDELMYLAKKYLLGSFFADCCKFLSEQKESEGILIGYAQSIRFELVELKQSLEGTIGNSCCEIFHSEHFAAIDRNLLEQITQIPVLRVENSKLIFDGCMSWAQAACKRKNIDAAVMQNLRDQLGDCFRHIEFSSMIHSEITKCVEHFGDLFTAKELRQIVFMVSAKCTIQGDPRRSKYEKFEISTQTNVRVEASKGSQEQLHFITKDRMMLRSFTVSPCSEFGDDGKKGYVASIVRITSGNNQKLHAEFFPFDKEYAFREDVVLEENSTYFIEILFLNDVAFFARDITHAIDFPFQILSETNTKFIEKLDIKRLITQ